MAIELVNEAEKAQTWGECLRAFRLQLGLSQEGLADQIMLVCSHMSVVDAARFERLRLECPEALAGNEISRYESGKRLPLKRSFHILLIWVLIQSGVSISVETANGWLEMGKQGWLTEREKDELFC
jgi:transcriptional regulator with XRE-family HTH domain